MHETLRQSHYQQPSVILSSDSFVHRRQAVSVSKIQMSTALNQHLDTLCWKAGLHGHREWSLCEGRHEEGGIKKSEQSSFTSFYFGNVISPARTHKQSCRKLTSTIRVMEIWIKTFIKDFGHFLYCSSLNVIQKLFQTGLRGRGVGGGGGGGMSKWVGINTVHRQCLTDMRKKYLCAEFGKSLFIQIRLFVHSGFVPKLRSRKR